MRKGVLNPTLLLDEATDGSNDPSPFLAIEMEVSHSSANKMGLYAAWPYPEVWQICLDKEDGISATIYVLEGETYSARGTSVVLPG